MQGDTLVLSKEHKGIFVWWFTLINDDSLIIPEIFRTLTEKIYLQFVGTKEKIARKS